MFGVLALGLNENGTSIQLFLTFIISHGSIVFIISHGSIIFIISLTISLKLISVVHDIIFKCAFRSLMRTMRSAH